MLPAVRTMKSGVFCFNPPYGVRIGAEDGEDKLLALYSTSASLCALPRLARGVFRREPELREAFAHAPTMTKPASNANLRGAFHLFQL